MTTDIKTIEYHLEEYRKSKKDSDKEKLREDLLALRDQALDLGFMDSRRRALFDEIVKAL